MYSKFRFRLRWQSNMGTLITFDRLFFSLKILLILQWSTKNFKKLTFYWIQKRYILKPVQHFYSILYLKFFIKFRNIYWFSLIYSQVQVRTRYSWTAQTNTEKSIRVVSPNSARKKELLQYSSSIIQVLDVLILSKSKLLIVS